MPNKIFFRADGNPSIGLGHIVRSIALADMLADHFKCVFLVQDPSSKLASYIELNHSLISLPATTDYLQEAIHLSHEFLSKNSIIVLDGYEFRTSYQKEVKISGCKLVCIDDLHAWPFLANTIINHSASVKEEDYDALGNTQFLLGLDYALLRKPFLSKNVGGLTSNSGSKSIFISLGGADPENHTLEVLEYCKHHLSALPLKVLIGSSNRHIGKLKEFKSKNSKLTIDFFYDLNATAVQALMVDCSYAITAASSVSYEYLSTGGTLFLVNTAENQQEMYTYFITNKLAHPLEQSTKITDSREFGSLIKNSPPFIDCNQGQRFVEAFLQINSSI